MNTNKPIKTVNVIFLGAQEATYTHSGDVPIAQLVDELLARGGQIFRFGQKDQTESENQKEYAKLTSVIEDSHPATTYVIVSGLLPSTEAALVVYEVNKKIKTIDARNVVQLLEPEPGSFTTETTIRKLYDHVYHALSVDLPNIDQPENTIPLPFLISCVDQLNDIEQATQNVRRMLAQYPTSSKFAAPARTRANDRLIPGKQPFVPNRSNRRQSWSEVIGYNFQIPSVYRPFDTNILSKGPADEFDGVVFVHAATGRDVEMLDDHGMCGMEHIKKAVPNACHIKMVSYPDIPRHAFEAAFQEVVSSTVQAFEGKPVIHVVLQADPYYVTSAVDDSDIVCSYTIWNHLMFNSTAGVALIQAHNLVNQFTAAGPINAAILNQPAD